MVPYCCAINCNEKGTKANHYLPTHFTGTAGIYGTQATPPILKKAFQRQNDV
ncbi:unnamed protein product, partial [Larinioides sclopetarius]